MYEIGVNAQFEAAHQLVGDFGPATRMHGHTYRLEVSVRGPKLSSDGTLFDLTRLQAAVTTLVQAFHYHDLGEVPGLAGLNTTAEVVANYCWRQIAADLADLGMVSLCVRLWENPGTYAAYEAALPTR
jgi:6-pyruvoyltetrahydropterin/6-carboxytetrahydropterin synthase